MSYCPVLSSTGRTMDTEPPASGCPASGGSAGSQGLADSGGPQGPDISGGSSGARTPRCVAPSSPGEGGSLEEEARARNGRVVAGQYALVRAVCSYLPWRDLETCAQVTWLRTLPQPLALALALVENLNKYTISRCALCGRMLLIYV